MDRRLQISPSGPFSAINIGRAATAPVLPDIPRRLEKSHEQNMKMFELKKVSFPPSSTALSVGQEGYSTLPLIGTKPWMVRDSNVRDSSYRHLRIDEDGEVHAWIPSQYSCRNGLELTGQRSRLRGKEALHIFQQIPDSVCLSVIIEEALDQLAILGHIIPKSTSYDMSKSSNLTEDDEIDIQKFIKIHSASDHSLSSVSSTRSHLRGISRAEFRKTRAATQKTEMRHGIERVCTPDLSRREAIERLKVLVSHESLIGKVEQDRKYADKVLSDLLNELRQKSSFFTISEAVKAFKAHRRGAVNLTTQMQNSFKKIKELQQTIAMYKHHSGNEIDMRNERITELKDCIQQMKIKGALERKYIIKLKLADIQDVERRHKLEDEVNIDAVEKLKGDMMDEERCHNEIVNYLTNDYERLVAKREYWAAKYYKDNEDKARALQILKQSREKDLERMSELTRLYAEYEQVVVDNRITVERLRKEEEIEMMRAKAACRMQAWWRGTMVRKGFGPWRKKKKPRGRKGKKGKGKGRAKGRKKK